MTTITPFRPRPHFNIVRDPSPRLREAFEDHRRLKAAYDHLVAYERDNLVAIAMLLHDLEPVERHLAALLLKVDTGASNKPHMNERAVARARESHRAKPSRPRTR